MSLKKAMISGLAALALMVSGASMAGATPTTYEINLYGASAQKDFWVDASPAWLTAASPTGFACQNTQQGDCGGAGGGVHGLTVGTGCEVDGDTQADDTIIIRYSAKASYEGCCSVTNENADDTCASDCGTDGWRDMCDAIGDTALTCTNVTLGASDVEGESLVQSSFGAENGFEGGTYSTNLLDGYDMSGMEDAADYGWSVVVPFGFFANNKVTRGTCCKPCPGTYPDFQPPVDIPNHHKSYSRWGDRCWPTDANGDWFDPVGICDVAGTGTCTAGPRSGQPCTTDQECPTYSHRCIGYYKCVDGVCNGGTREGLTCSKTQDCPDVNYEDTACVQMPIQNLPRIKAILLFKDTTLTNWQQFGREYANLPITRCMRHAGSGTHATLDLAVLGDKFTPHAFSSGTAAFHHRSSSTLTRCVGAYDGGVGYADADKLLGKGGDYYENVHAVDYNGHPALRRNVTFCEYTFWSAQHTYWDPTEVVSGAAPYSLEVHQKFLQFAGNPDNLTCDNVGYHADYWAAGTELGCTKANDRAFPTFNPNSAYPFDQTWADCNPY
jgi:hypothetical protein